jgi:hypothetical protein
MHKHTTTRDHKKQNRPEYKKKGTKKGADKSDVAEYGFHNEEKTATCTQTMHQNISAPS